MVNNISVVLIFLCSFISSIAFAEFKVLYIPVATETYVPVTSENIEQQAHYIFTTKDIGLKNMVALIQNNKTVKKMNEINEILNLRVKIIDLKSKKAFFIDNLYKTYDENGDLAPKESAEKIVNLIDQITKTRCLKNKRAKFIRPLGCSK